MTCNEESPGGERRHGRFATAGADAPGGLAAAFMATPDAVLITRACDGLIDDANEGFTRLTGHSREWCVGRTTLELGLWVEPAERLNLVSTCLKHGSARDVENRFRRANGDIAVVLVSACLLEIDGEQWLYSVTKDITERERERAALRRYELLAESARDIILFVRESDGRIVEANRAAIEAYVCSPEEMLTKTIFELRAGATATKVRQNMEAAALTGVQFEAKHRRCDGTVFPVEVSSRGALTMDGETILLSIVRDITERKRAEQQLHEYSDRLRLLASRLSISEEQERRRLATELHDRVTQPLAAARMRLEMSELPGVSAAAAAAHRAVAASMLVEAMEEARAITTQLSPPILRELGLKPALEWLAERMEAYNLSCSRELADLRAELPSDLEMLVFRAAHEFLMNAARHSGEETASLVMTADDRGVTVTVTDQGRGFEELPPVKGHSCGFGLFSIKERAEQMGAEVTIESTLGGGTTASIIVPFERPRL